MSEPPRHPPTRPGASTGPVTASRSETTAETRLGVGARRRRSGGATTSATTTATTTAPRRVMNRASSSGRSADASIRASLASGREALDASGRLGVGAIRKGWLNERNPGKFGGWTRRYFVLDGVGRLMVYGSTSAEARGYQVQQRIHERPSAAYLRQRSTSVLAVGIRREPSASRPGESSRGHSRAASEIEIDDDTFAALDADAEETHARASRRGTPRWTRRRRGIRGSRYRHAFGRGVVVRQTGRGAGPERARTKVRTGGGRRPRPGGSHALVRQTGRGRGGSIDDGSSVLFSRHLAHGVSVAAGGVRGGGVGVGVRPAGHHRRAHQRGPKFPSFGRRGVGADAASPLRTASSRRRSPPPPLTWILARCSRRRPGTTRARIAAARIRIGRA